MSNLIECIDSYGMRKNFYCDLLPDSCSFCNKNVEFISHFCYLDNGKHIYSLFLECPHCHNFSVFSMDSDFNTIYFYPAPMSIEHPPTEIERLSPSFKSIYEQSQIAEKHGLTEICGMGYRKALEFLIKDYLIMLYPQDTDIISKETLMQSIKRIKHTQIQILAEKTAWLGNDETHYIRKHTDRDLQDLKRFLFAIIKYIDMECTVMDAKQIQKV